MGAEEDNVGTNQCHEKKVLPIASYSDSSIHSLSNLTSEDNGQCTVAISNLNQKNDFIDMIPAQVIDQASKIMSKRGSSPDNARYAALLDFKASLKTGGAWKQQRARSESRCETKSCFQSKNSNNPCIEDSSCAQSDSFQAKSDNRQRRREMYRQKLRELSKKLDQERSFVCPSKTPSRPNCSQSVRQRPKSAVCPRNINAKKRESSSQVPASRVDDRSKRSLKTNVTFSEADLDSTCTAHRSETGANGSTVDFTSCAKNKLLKSPETEPFVIFTGQEEQQARGKKAKNRLQSPAPQDGKRKSEPRTAVHRQNSRLNSQPSSKQARSMTSSQSRPPLPAKVIVPATSEARMREEKRWLLDQILFRLSPQFQKYQAGQNPEDDYSKLEQYDSNYDVTISEEESPVQLEAVKTNKDIKPHSNSKEKSKAGRDRRNNSRPKKPPPSRQPATSFYRSSSMDSKPKSKERLCHRGRSQSPCMDHLTPGRTKVQKFPTMKVKYVAPSTYLTTAKSSKSKFVKRAMLQCLPSTGEKMKGWKEDSLFLQSKVQRDAKKQGENRSGPPTRELLKGSLPQPVESGSSLRKTKVASQTSPAFAPQKYLEELLQCLSPTCPDGAKKMEQLMKVGEIKQHILQVKQQIYDKAPGEQDSAFEDVSLPDDRLNLKDRFVEAYRERLEIIKAMGEKKESKGAFLYPGNDSSALKEICPPPGETNKICSDLIKHAAILSMNCKESQDNLKVTRPGDKMEEVKPKSECISSEKSQDRDRQFELEKNKIMQLVKEHFIRRRDQWSERKNAQTQSSGLQLIQVQDIPSQPKNSELKKQVSCEAEDSKNSAKIETKSSMDSMESPRPKQVGRAGSTDSKAPPGSSPIRKSCEQRDDKYGASPSSFRKTKDIKEKSCIANKQGGSEISEPQTKKGGNGHTLRLDARCSSNEVKCNQENGINGMQPLNGVSPLPAKQNNDIEGGINTRTDVSTAEVMKDKPAGNEGNQERIQAHTVDAPSLRQAVPDEIKHRAFKFQNVRKLFENNPSFKPWATIQEVSSTSESTALQEKNPRNKIDPNEDDTLFRYTKTSSSSLQSPSQNDDCEHELKRVRSSKSKQRHGIIRRRTISAGEGIKPPPELHKKWKMKSKSTSKLAQKMAEKKPECHTASRDKALCKPSVIENLLKELKNHILLERVSQGLRSYDSSETDQSARLSSVASNEIPHDTENPKSSLTENPPSTAKKTNACTTTQASLDSEIASRPNGKRKTADRESHEVVNPNLDPTPHTVTTIVLVGEDKGLGSSGLKTPCYHQVYHFKNSPSPNGQPHQLEMPVGQKNKLTAEQKSYLISLIRDCDLDNPLQEDSESNLLDKDPDEVVHKVGQFQKKASAQPETPDVKDSIESSLFTKNVDLQFSNTTQQAQSVSANLQAADECCVKGPMNEIQIHFSHLKPLVVSEPWTCVTHKDGEKPDLVRKKQDSLLHCMNTQASNVCMGKTEINQPPFQTSHNLLKTTTGERQHYKRAAASLQEKLDQAFGERDKQHQNVSFRNLTIPGQHESLTSEKVQHHLPQTKITHGGLSESNDVQLLDMQVSSMTYNEQTKILCHSDQPICSITDKNNTLHVQRDQSPLLSSGNFLHVKSRLYRCDKDNTLQQRGTSTLRSNDHKETTQFLKSNRASLSYNDTGNCGHLSGGVYNFSNSDKENVTLQKSNLSTQVCKEKNNILNLESTLSSVSRNDTENGLKPENNLSRYNNENLPHLQSNQFAGIEQENILHPQKNLSTVCNDDKYYTQPVSNSNQPNLSTDSCCHQKQHENLQTCLRRMSKIQESVLSDMPSYKAEPTPLQAEHLPYQSDFISFKANRSFYQTESSPSRPKLQSPASERPPCKDDTKSCKTSNLTCQSDLKPCQPERPIYKPDETSHPSYGPQLPAYKAEISNQRFSLSHHLPNHPHPKTDTVYQTDQPSCSYPPFSSAFQRSVNTASPNLTSDNISEMSQSHIAEVKFSVNDSASHSRHCSFANCSSTRWSPTSMPEIMQRRPGEMGIQQTSTAMDSKQKAELQETSLAKKAIKIEESRTRWCPTDILEAMQRRSVGKGSQQTTTAMNNKQEKELQDTNMAKQPIKVEESRKHLDPSHIYDEFPAQLASSRINSKTSTDFEKNHIHSEAAFSGLKPRKSEQEKLRDLFKSDAPEVRENEDKKETSSLIAPTMSSTSEDSSRCKLKEILKRDRSPYQNLSPRDWSPALIQTFRHQSPKAGMQEKGPDHTPSSQGEFALPRESAKYMNCREGKDSLQNHLYKDLSPPHASIKQLSPVVSPLLRTQHLIQDQRSAYQPVGQTNAEVVNLMKQDQYTLGERSSDRRILPREKLESNFEPKPHDVPTSVLLSKPSQWHTGVPRQQLSDALNDRHPEYATEQERNMSNRKEKGSMEPNAKKGNDGIPRQFSSELSHSPKTWSRTLSCSYILGCQSHDESDDMTMRKEKSNFQDSGQESIRWDDPNTTQLFPVINQDMPLDLSSKSKHNVSFTTINSVESDMPLNLCIRPFRDDSMIGVSQESPTHKSANLSRMKSSSALDLTTHSASASTYTNISKQENHIGFVTPHHEDGVMGVYDRSHEDLATGNQSYHAYPEWTLGDYSLSHQQKMSKTKPIPITSQNYWNIDSALNSCRLHRSPSDISSFQVQRPNFTQFYLVSRRFHGLASSESKQTSNENSYSEFESADDNQRSLATETVDEENRILHNVCPKENQNMSPNHELRKLSSFSPEHSELDILNATMKINDLVQSSQVEGIQEKGDGTLEEKSISVQEQVKALKNEKNDTETMAEVEVSNNLKKDCTDEVLGPHLPTPSKSSLNPNTPERCQTPEIKETSQAGHSHEREPDCNHDIYTSSGTESLLKSTLGQPLEISDLSSVMVHRLRSPASSKSSVSDVTVVSSSVSPGESTPSVSSHVTITSSPVTPDQVTPSVSSHVTVVSSSVTPGQVTPSVSSHVTVVSSSVTPGQVTPSVSSHVTVVSSSVTLGQVTPSVSSHVTVVSSSVTPGQVTPSVSWHATVVASPVTPNQCTPTISSFVTETDPGLTEDDQMDVKESSTLRQTESCEKTESVSVSQGDSFHSCCSMFSL